MSPYHALLLPLVIAATPAAARTQVTAAVPAADATVAAPAEIRLTLSEPVVAAGSGAALTMTAMPGMSDHPPMRIATRTAVAADGRTLVLKPMRKLPPGQYRVDWHAAAADGQRVTGTHVFAVR